MPQRLIAALGFCISLVELALNARIPSDRWRVSALVRRPRAAWLNSSPDFTAIIEQLLNGLAGVKLKKEPCKKDPGHFRLLATLSFHNINLVDAFHNSSSGYRAQYLESTEIGERANAFAVDRFKTAIIDRFERSFPTAWDREWAYKSLHSRLAKTWIHQGLWLRHARESCEDLVVDDWLVARGNPDPEIRKKARYGRILPFGGSEIDFKGGWVKEFQGSLVTRETFKPDRAHCINKYGFT